MNRQNNENLAYTCLDVLLPKDLLASIQHKPCNMDAVYLQCYKTSAILIYESVNQKTNPLDSSCAWLQNDIVKS